MIKQKSLNKFSTMGLRNYCETLKTLAFQTCLMPLVENEQVIFISTNLEKELVKLDFEGCRFVVMLDNQMRKQVETKKGECYFRIAPFIVKGSKVTVVLTRNFNLPAYILGIGFRYEFEKVNGMWKRNLLGNYQVQS